MLFINKSLVAPISSLLMLSSQFVAFWYSLITSKLQRQQHSCKVGIFSFVQCQQTSGSLHWGGAGSLFPQTLSCLYLHCPSGTWRSNCSDECQSLCLCSLFFAFIPFFCCQLSPLMFYRCCLACLFIYPFFKTFFFFFPCCAPGSGSLHPSAAGP